MEGKGEVRVEWEGIGEKGARPDNHSSYPLVFHPQLVLWDSRSVQTNNQQRGDVSLLLILFFLTPRSHSFWPQTPGRGCGHALCLRWSLEMLAGLVRQQFTCCSLHDKDSTEQACGLGKSKNTMWIQILWALRLTPSTPDVWWKGRPSTLETSSLHAPVCCLLFLIVYHQNHNQMYTMEASTDLSH